MRLPPRLAVGSICEGHDPRLMLWALHSALAAVGLRVQPYRDRACLTDPDFGGVAVGRRTRNLDHRLFGPSLCRRLLRQGTPTGAWALVSGCYHRRSTTAGTRAPSNLIQLSETLDLPRLAVLEAARLTPCQIPAMAGMDGVLLIGPQTSAEAQRWELEIALRGGPGVWGWLPREVCEESRCDLSSNRPSRRTIQMLGDALLPRLNYAALVNLARRRVGKRQPPAAAADIRPTETERPRIAVAFDDVFTNYFPETLELLTAGGAELVDFSPLRDDRLPPETDLVYFGDADPNETSAAIGANCCLAHNLRRYANEGGRVLAEGRGTVFLCQDAQTRDGKLWPMTGLLPAHAFETGDAGGRPTEFKLPEETWLGPRGAVLSGYTTPDWKWWNETTDDAFQTSRSVLVRRNIVALPCPVPMVSHPRSLRGMLRPSPLRQTVSAGVDEL